MCQQQDARGGQRQRESARDPPLLRWKQAGCRGQRPHVQRVARWKSVVRAAGPRHAAPMAFHGETIRPGLIDGPLEQVWQYGRQQGYRQDVIGDRPQSRPARGVKPGADGEREQQLLVGAPRQELGGLLEFRRRPGRERSGDRPVGFCRTDGEGRHRSPCPIRQRPMPSC